MQKELKERKQCSYKPSSVPIPSETIRAPVIYLVPESPLGSSTLPSAAARRQSDEPPSICGLHELTAPRWHSLAITRQLVVSYTTFSPLPDTNLTANFSEFLNSFRFLGMILLLSHPERLTFQSSFSLVSFTFVCISRSFNFIYKTIIFQKSSK